MVLAELFSRNSPSQPLQPVTQRQEYDSSLVVTSKANDMEQDMWDGQVEEDEGRPPYVHVSL